MGTTKLFIEGLTVPIVHYRINWADSVRQSFIFATRIHASGLQKEQRGTTSQESDLRHQMNVSYLCDGKIESKRIYNRLFGLKGKPCVVPWLAEPLESDIDCAGLSYFDVKNMGTKYIKVKTNQVLRIDCKNMDLIECRKVSSIDNVTGRIEVENPWEAEIPSWRQVFFFGRGVVLADLRRTHNNDQVHGLDVRWRSHDDGLLP